MAARGILQNPAMYAGYDETPLECVKDWVSISNLSSLCIVLGIMKYH